MFNNNLTLLRNSTFDVTWTSGRTSSLTNKVLELVSKLVVHSSINRLYCITLRVLKNRSMY